MILIDILVKLFMTALILTGFIGSCRILSMTFKTFSRSITIKNRKLAAMLIAYKNTWAISTSPEKRNKMSLLGAFSYIVFLPEIAFLAYDWWVFIKTGVVLFCCSAEETYLALAPWFYAIGLSLKITEADRFRKGKIW